MSAEPNGYMLRFADGKMSLVGNTRNLGGGMDWTIPRELFGWPLPERLHTLCHPGFSENAAMWPEGDPGDLPAEITGSPNVEVYVKVSESGLPDDSLSHVMRGAEYRLAATP